MLQRATDATFLGVFSALYSVAVFVMRLCRKPVSVTHRLGTHTAPQRATL